VRARVIFVPVGVAIGWLVGFGVAERWLFPNCMGTGCRLAIGLAGIVGAFIGSRLAIAALVIWNRRH
jgi:hypothetical protein